MLEARESEMMQERFLMLAKVLFLILKGLFISLY